MDFPSRRILSSLRKLLLALSLAASCAVGASPSLIVLEAGQKSLALASKAEFWLDANASAEPNDVEALGEQIRFAPYSDRQVNLLEDKALWLRFDVQRKDPTRRWLLELQLAGVDAAELFYRGADGVWIRQLAGDAKPISSWPQRGRYPVFALSYSSSEPIRYYLRIQHARVPYSAPLVLISDSDLTAEHEADHFLLGIYFGLAGLLVIIASAIAATHRDTGFATYALYVLLLAMTQAAFAGVSALYLWPESPRWSQASVFLLPMLAAAAAIGFVRTVGSPKQFSMALDRFLLALMLVLSITGVLDAVVPTVEGFAVNNILLSAAVTVVLMIVVLSALEGDRHARWVALGFLPILVAAIFPLLRNFGVLPASTATSYALLFGSALEAPILFYGLYRRLIERREAAARAGALRQSDPLTGLVVARVLDLRLSSALLRAKRYQHQCALLLVDLSNYQALLETHGREVAARALVVAASRLQTVVRDVDSAARSDLHQFALLIEGPMTGAEALSIATHAVAQGLRETPELPAREPLKFRVVVAILPHENHDGTQVLGWMRRGLAALDENSPKTIRALNF